MFTATFTATVSADGARAGTSSSLTTTRLLQAGILDVGLLAAGNAGGGAATGRASHWELRLYSHLVGRRSSERGGGASLFVECPLGGFAQFDCTSTATHSTIDALYLDCVFQDEETGVYLVSTGDQVAKIADPDVCSTGMVPMGAPLDLTSVRFEQRVFNADLSASSRIEYRDSDITLDIESPGCLGFDATQRKTGLVDFRCQKGIEGIPCLIDGFEATAVYDDFEVDSTSAMVQGECVVDNVLHGDATYPVDDFRAIYQSFASRLRMVGADHLLFEEQGSQTLPCLGRTLSYDNVEPVELAPDSPCPIAGLIEIGEAPGQATRVRFLAGGGIEIDLGADGSVDEAFASCTDSALAQCFVSAPPPTPTPQGAKGFFCDPCAVAGDCDSRLGCFPCSEECTGTVSRCVPDDIFLDCEDGVF